MLCSDAMRLARELRGMTQAQLASRIGSHQSVVSALERGQLDPHMSVVLRICQELDLQPSSFLRGPPNEGSLLDPRPLMRWMTAGHFVAHRRDGLGETLQHVLSDVRGLRPDFLALTVHLFDREPMRYAGAVAGRYGVTIRELIIEARSLRDTRGELYHGWMAHAPVREDSQACALAAVVLVGPPARLRKTLFGRCVLH